MSRDYDERRDSGPFARLWCYSVDQWSRWREPHLPGLELHSRRADSDAVLLPLVGLLGDEKPHEPPVMERRSIWADDLDRAEREAAAERGQEPDHSRGRER